MTNNAYHFVTHWRIRGTCEEVAGVHEHGLRRVVDVRTQREVDRRRLLT